MPRDSRRWANISADKYDPPTGLEATKMRRPTWCWAGADGEERPPVVWAKIGNLAPGVRPKAIARHIAEKTRRLVTIPIPRGRHLPARSGVRRNRSLETAPALAWRPTALFCPSSSPPPAPRDVRLRPDRG